MGYYRSSAQSLRRAAETLNIRQSKLSRGLRDLEHRLGAILFERTSDAAAVARTQGASRSPIDRRPARSRAHWVRPELIAEVTYLTWTAEGLLRHVVYEGLREDKPARDVRRTG